jgi:two-component system, NtrC family, nitrogen regulation sensor histidine kinase NtrY
MENSKIVRSNYNWWYLVAGFAALVTALVLQLNFYVRNYPERVSNHFQSVLHEKENRLYELTESCAKEFRQHVNKDRRTISWGSEDLFDDDGMAFFCFRRDSLAFWTTNSIPGAEAFLVSGMPLDSGAVRLKNGWYEIRSFHQKDITVVGLLLIKKSYPIKNEFLNDDFQEDFSVPEGTKIRRGTGQNSIYSVSGKPLFRLVFPEVIKANPLLVYLLLALYLSAALFILNFLCKLIRKNEKLSDKRWIGFTTLFTGVLLFRFLQVSFRFPEILYSSDLFGPKYFSFSNFLPSLGDLFIDSVLFLFFAYSIFISLSLGSAVQKEKSRNSPFQNFLRIISVLLLFGITFFLEKVLILNSSFSLNLQNIASLSASSIFALAIIASFGLGSFLIAFRLVASISWWQNKKASLSAKKLQITISLVIAFLILFSLSSTYIINGNNNIREKEKRKLIAIKLGVKRDPMAEMMFARKETALLQDSIFLNVAGEQQVRFDNLREDSLARAIQRKYFREGWNNYSVQVTLCIGQKILKIQPQNYLYDCGAYFRNLVEEFGQATASRHLFFLDYGYGYKNYLAIIPIADATGLSPLQGTAYIEISSNLLQKDQGYPGLLSNNTGSYINDVSEYSYAFYRDRKLIQKVGNYEYKLEINTLLKAALNEPNFYSREGYNHLLFPISKQDLLIISRSEPSATDKIAPFSYLFFFFTVFTVLFYAIVGIRGLFRNFLTRMSDRIQVSMTGIMFVSFLIIGVVMTVYIGRFYMRKNAEILNERTHSILVELQHKYGNTGNLGDLNRDDLNEQMTKYSNVFFTDVNLYDPSGTLIATSRPEIFEKNLLSVLMNPSAFVEMTKVQRSYFSLDEKICNYHFNSAYMPFYNDHNQLLGYLNLPYFTRQEELKREISSFMVTFINVYVILLIVGIVVSIIVSTYISHPLKMLTIMLGQITFGKNNEKIIWHRQDEIGRLITEYNRMVEELEKSAEILIRSEREGAWREMAKQVAHEIKNPLTPMKLNVQYLQKAWRDKAVDMNERLERFSKTMIEEIEALSMIAEEFSNFAKMPQAIRETLDLDDVIRSVLSLYQDFPNIRYIRDKAVSKPVIKADRKQLFRVFTNLINNALQAISTTLDGRILVSLETEAGNYLVKIADNGIGIPSQQQEKIFQPNFTTKSGGMGLGLAIVKNIIQETGGEITFDSKTDKGTTFFIRFPSETSQ